MQNTNLKDELHQFREEESRVRRAFLERERQEKEFKRKQLLKYGISYSFLSTFLTASTLMMVSDMSSASAITYSVISGSLIGFSSSYIRYSIDLFRRNNDFAKENLAFAVAIFAGACLLTGVSSTILNKTVFKNEPYVIKKQEEKLLKKAELLSTEIDSFISKLPSERQTEFKMRIRNQFNLQEKTPVVTKHKNLLTNSQKTKERTE